MNGEEESGSTSGPPVPGRVLLNGTYNSTASEAPLLAQLKDSTVVPTAYRKWRTEITADILAASASALYVWGSQDYGWQYVMGGAGANLFVTRKAVKDVIHKIENSKMGRGKSILVFGAAGISAIPQALSTVLLLMSDEGWTGDADEALKITLAVLFGIGGLIANTGIHAYPLVDYANHLGQSVYKLLSPLPEIINDLVCQGRSTKEAYLKSIINTAVHRSIRQKAKNGELTSFANLLQTEDSSIMADNLTTILNGARRQKITCADHASHYTYRLFGNAAGWCTVLAAAPYAPAAQQFLMDELGAPSWLASIAAYGGFIPLAGIAHSWLHDVVSAPGKLGQKLWTRWTQLKRPSRFFPGDKVICCIVLNAFGTWLVVRSYATTDKLFEDHVVPILPSDDYHAPVKLIVQLFTGAFNGIAVTEYINLSMVPRLIGSKKRQAIEQVEKFFNCIQSNSHEENIHILDSSGSDGNGDGTPAREQNRGCWSCSWFRTSTGRYREVSPNDGEERSSELRSTSAGGDDANDPNSGLDVVASFWNKTTSRSNRDIDANTITSESHRLTHVQDTGENGNGGTRTCPCVIL